MADALILEAAGSGDIAKFEEIKKRIGDDDEFQRKCDAVNDFCVGRRVLHYAAEMGILEICQFLIENVGVKIDVLTDKGATPLQYAVKEGHVEIVEYLIEQGALVDMSDSKGFTSLHYAVQKDNKELVKLLLIRGARIEADSVDGTPLQCAASRGNVETVKLLLDHGAKTDTFSLVFGSPLICAIKSHSSACVELLLKAGAGPDKFLYGLNPLAHAAKEGETDILMSLLEAGANPNLLSTGFLRPIEEAALAHKLESVKILFPQTQRVPHYPNWTVDGITEHLYSEEAKTKREQEMRSYLDIEDKRGKTAFSRKDYRSAVISYSLAAFLDPSNTKWLLNRSLCFARLGRAVHALHDAEECIRMEPECAKAHYREGAAWKLFKNYHMSALAFQAASLLAPQNKEVLEAYRGAVDDYLSDLYRSFPVEMSEFYATV
ncbi:hypothetical protein C2S51_022710 [Perilla frutescens var. frutescens]|nr:hypothetical protein C2S51_022710 [Perilla frutescens var. frutescens]